MICSYSLLRCSAIAAAQSLALVCALSPQVDAAVLAQDRFDTYTAGRLQGQSGSPVGFSGSWNSNTANLQAESSGILDRDPSNGQGKWEPSPAFSNIFRRADRQLSPVSAPPNNTFYTQHLVNAGNLRGAGANQDYAFIGFGSFVAQETIEGTANNLLGAFTGFVDDGQGSIDLVIRSRTGFSPDVVTDTLLVSDAVNVTYNVIMALEYDVNGNGGIADEIRWWVDPSDYSNGEAGLDATAIVSGTIPGVQLTGPFDMNRLSVMTYGFDRSFFFDESTLATSIDDLLPLAPDIPEPTTTLLAGLAVVSASARRRVSGSV